MPAIVHVRSIVCHIPLYQRYDMLCQDHPVYFDASRNIRMITPHDNVLRSLHY
ncbi:MAG: hypothetical protein KA159_02145 [Halioglobus sp.]|nr:hypothetical protein [Halioglobus sp.]MBP6723634.1 hypothetical protein [Halioglobus sp.]